MDGLKATDYKALDEALRAVWEAEQDCEHPEHERSDKHAGTAQYYVHIRHSCGLDLVEAVCGVWKGWLDANIVVRCRECGVYVKSGEFVLRSTGIR